MISKVFEIVLHRAFSSNTTRLELSDSIKEWQEFDAGTGIPQLFYSVFTFTRSPFAVRKHAP